jgi:IS1 family transposase
LTGHLKRNRFVIHAEKSGQSGWRDVVSPPHAAIWGFLQKKQRHVGPYDNPEYGDVWTFCVIDAESKLVPSFKVGKRDLKTANVFVDDLAGRLSNRVQISSDGLRAYVDSIEQTFGADVDYGQIIKTYQSDSSQSPERKYSPPRISSAEKIVFAGNPNQDLISTNYVERLNATTRLHMRRLTRLALGFSKKLENFEAAVALHFAYYNFVKFHKTLRCTPAMASGVERSPWTVSDLVDAVEWL